MTATIKVGFYSSVVLAAAALSLGTIGWFVQ